MTNQITSEQLLKNFEPTGRFTTDGTPIWQPKDIGGCGGCDNGECCGDGEFPCCGQGEYGECEDV